MKKTRDNLAAATTALGLEFGGCAQLTPKRHALLVAKTLKANANCCLIKELLNNRGNGITVAVPKGSPCALYTLSAF